MVCYPLRGCHCDTLELRPLPARLPIGQLVRVPDGPTPPGPDAPVTLVERLAAVVVQILETAPAGAGEPVLDIFTRSPLVVCKRQDLIGFPLHDQPGDLLLATHSSNGYDTTGNLQEAPKLG